MRILLVCGSAPPMPCGVGDYSLRLARALAEEGHDVALLTSTGAAASISSNPAVLPLMPDWRVSRLGRLYKAITSWRPDVVHLQYPARGFTSSLLPALVPAIALVARARVVRTWHEPTTWGDIRNWRGLVPFALQAFVPGRFISVRPDLIDRVHPALRRLSWAKRLRYIASGSTLPHGAMTPDQREQQRCTLLNGAERLVLFFGFINPAKNVDQVLAAADPSRDRIIFAGGYDPASPLVAMLRSAAEHGPWKDRVHLAGFVSPADASTLLAVADAVLLPFTDGSGDWNTSLQAAVAQGTLVVTTTRGTPGYDAQRNVARVPIGDTQAMREALETYAGHRVEPHHHTQWQRIANEHLALYRPGTVA